MTATFSPQMREAEDLEQNNADGGSCVADRTPAERRWWNVTLNLCKVNTCLYQMFTGWEAYLGYDGSDIGFSDKKEVRTDYGVAVEIWTGVGVDDECDEPTSDDILTGGLGGSVKYGYLVAGAVKEWALSGDLEIGAQVSTFSLTGRTAAATRWGRGPYNVQATDAQNTAGRMLTPMKKDQHIRMFETTVAPPEPSSECCPLVLPSPYYGLTPAPVAPNQPACDAVGSNEIQSVALSGTPTGGTYTLSFGGQTTAPIAYNAASTVVETALEALSSIGTGNVTVTGTGPWAVEFTGQLAETNFPLMTADGTALTGGTDPDVAVTQTQAGGVYA
ncbi:hypothetical protein [Nocardia carnea]|uniref:hypothetical protein n=1 Tax=Nocardia carnea TaxID=37328 RepID=UPI00245815F2|nr:hypothetical protein [Nocardia carnea]